MKKLIIPILAGLFVASLVWSAYAIAPWQGGTGQDTSGWTLIIRVDSGTWSTTTAAAGLWTDGGTFTYLTATSDDVVFGSNSTTTAPFWFDVSATTSYLGTIGSGTWQGTAIAHEYGGIEADISAVKKGELLIGTAAGTIGLFATGTDDYVLTASSSATGGTVWAAAAAGGATIELDNLGTVAINTSLISDTDSTDDLGSSSKFWKDAYIDRVFFATDAKIYPSGNDLYIFTSSGAVKIGYATNRVLSIEPSSSRTVLRSSVGYIGVASDFSAVGDSSYDLGRSSLFWDNTFTDELYLTNVGAASAAADKLVISAIDYSAGHTILDINTEGTEVVTSTADVAASKLLRIRINGTVYEILVK